MKTRRLKDERQWLLLLRGSCGMTLLVSVFFWQLQTTRGGGSATQLTTNSSRSLASSSSAFAPTASSNDTVITNQTALSSLAPSPAIFSSSSSSSSSCNSVLDCPATYYECHPTTHTCFLPVCSSDLDCLRYSTSNNNLTSSSSTAAAASICNTAAGICVPRCHQSADCHGGLLCNNVTGHCVVCLSDVDCNNGLHCNVTAGGQCMFFTCTTNRDCINNTTNTNNSSSNLICHPLTGTCTTSHVNFESGGAPCLRTSDCVLGQECSNRTGLCVTMCTSNVTCYPGTLCDATLGECVATTSTLPAAACTSNQECASGDWCNAMTGQCVSGGNGGASGAAAAAAAASNPLARSLVLFPGAGGDGWVAILVLLGFSFV